MRFVVALTILFIVSVSVAAQSPRDAPASRPSAAYPTFTLSTATVSGDPHYTTFDGRYHDTMISGFYTMVDNDVITVQSSGQSCNTGITCLRYTAVEIRPSFTGEVLRIQFGWGWTGYYWQGPFAWDNVQIQENLAAGNRTFNLPPDQFQKLHPKGKTYCNGKYLIWFDGSLRLAATGTALLDPVTAVQVVIGKMFLSVGLPKIAPHLFNTNGLLGLFDGTNTNKNEFQQKGSSSASASLVVNTASRVNDKNVISWASSFAVNLRTNPPVFASFPHPHHFTMMSAEKHLFQTTTTFVDNSTDISNKTDIFQIQFPDLQTANKAAEFCRTTLQNIAPVNGNQDIANENCLMDATITFEVAASNAQATLAAQSMTNPPDDSILGLSPALFISVVTVSCVLFVALSTVGYLWYRNRALKAQVDSYALVVHQNTQGPSPIRSGDIEL